jgi:sulfhydrogenase subunit beta (sulfur reductase)
MADLILKKSDVKKFIQSLSGKYTVLGPVEQDGKVKFAKVEGDEMLFDYQNTYLSPKDLFFPQSERMFEFSTDPADEQAHILQEVPDDLASPRVVFGMRPCDAKAFAVLDLIFNNDEYSDVYWQRKRDNTVLIGLGCNDPCPTCFCTSMNCGPFHTEGLDALAFDLGDDVLIRPLTEKGEKALAEAKDLKKAPADAGKKADKLQKEAEKAITTEVPMDKIAERSVMELFEQEHWDRVNESCLNCGTCTYVCPTCHCFDIQDEVAGKVGDRMRNWDSCMSWLFTVHGTGHNPRPGKKERVRQRFMHKFKYIPLKRGGEIGCVGCGRCVMLCPVNIDVRDVVRNMNA